MSDITGVELTLTRVDDGEQGQDGKSAYESAVEGGYTGTESEFNDALASASDAVQYFWTDADGVHVTQVPQDEYVQDPTAAGINILINSTNGMQVLDGLTVLAMYSVTEIIGDPDGAHVEVTPSGVTIISSDGVIAFNVSASGGTATVEVTKNISRVIEEFPDTFTVSELGDAIAGSTFKLEGYVSGDPIPFRKTFTKGTASSESVSAHTIAYDGATGFTVTGSGTIRIYSVDYYATVTIPAVDMQGEVSVNGIKMLYEPGDSITYGQYESGLVITGFVTSSKTEDHYTIPLSKPCTASTVTITNFGIICRQNANYVHGTGATTYKTPSYTATLTGQDSDGAYTSIKVVCTWSNTTNVVNNAPIAANIRGTFTFA